MKPSQPSVPVATAVSTSRAVDRADAVGSPVRIGAGDVAAGVPVFGANEMRLNLRQWLAVLGIFAGLAALIPWGWARWERFETGPQYRIPYPLSRDYWLYERHLGGSVGPNHVIVLGDSVVWGEYVRPEGAWTVFLNQESQNQPTFVNAGVNGLFPLAMEGLVEHYGSMPRGQKVVVHCNLLWWTSPQADLSTEKEERFNHSRLVPQFRPRIPCYRADANERLGAVLEHQIPFLAWARHLQDAYFEQKSIPGWTLADDGGDPPQYPNAWRNPWSRIVGVVPAAPADDPLRGPTSARHKPWSTNGVGSTRFEWVPLDKSLQWAAFQRVVERLRSRGNDVYVVVGPFNEHLMEAGNRRIFREIRDGVTHWLESAKLPYWVPESLPSALYADASHPLTLGYQLMAQRAWAEPGFREWAGRR